MKHARSDYDRIQDPAGKIPEAEPVFLIRGQNAFGGAVLRYYASLVRAANGDPEIVKATLQHANEMDAWLRKKLPDMPIPEVMK